MRNLRNRKHARLDIEEPITATSWDPAGNALLIATGPNETHTVALKRITEHHGLENETTQTIASWDAPPPTPGLSYDKILDLHYFPDTNLLCVIFAGGDIVTVRESSGNDQIEIVGSVDAGIRAAAWSPDEEILALSTGADTLLYMTREFESLANITLSAEDLRVSNHVSVGWGKKETQFKGRGVAKTLRDPTMPEHVDEGTLSSTDDEKTTISWRGDGQYLAINTVLDGDAKRRVIRVYSRQGVLESVSEPVNGLEGALSWKPSGQLIASIRRQQDKIDVVFFERNGLRHGEFDLRLDLQEMNTIGSGIGLMWNTDSSVLAVAMRDRVQLWTMGNYHYYLKQEIILTSLDERSACWHPEKPLTLACSSGNTMHSLSYASEVCRGPVMPPHDTGLVAVIDGKTLKITPLQSANIPPPMALHEVELPENAIDVAINENGTEIGVLHSGSVSIWNCNYISRSAEMAVLDSIIQLEDHSQFHGAASPTLISERTRLFRHTDHDRIFYTSESASTRWTGQDGKELSFLLGENGVLHINQGRQAAITELHSLENGLTNSSPILRIPGCTSFIVTSAHLIFTTSQHLLKFVHLHIGKLDVPPDEPEKDERCRSIERGARIVTVMPSVYALVLQMPRGNLETIYPRALVLAGIRQSLRVRDYKKAFLTCRIQRVDMNILHDYIPKQFLADVDLFIKQIKRTEHIDLFLSSLSEENVAETMYRETLAPDEMATNGLLDGVDNSAVMGLPNGDATTHLPPLSSKTNRVCDAFLRVLQKDSAGRLQNIVTAHVCKNPPDLETGLRLVSTLRKSGYQERLEEAVEHICFLADVNQLYDTALGLYDLDVALLVAQQSQKDPREYLPYLQGLHDMDTLRQKFTIDHDLKRYRKALTHLHSVNDFEELEAYTIKHELYVSAIDLYRYDNNRLNELMRIYADFLGNRNRFREAGVAYEYIADHASAYEAFRSVTMWRECLYNAVLARISAAELSTLAQDLASSLEESKNFAGAATIHLDYLDDLEGSAKLLCKGYNFAEAMRQVSFRQKPELLEQTIDPGLIDGAASMTEMLAEMKSQLGAQLPRLRELRQKKADDPMAFLDGAEGGDGDIPDNISLAPTDASTSGGTFMTRYTNRSMGTLATNATRKTSKNRRREERKRARGKKGTVYEEEYLVNSIARLIERLNDVGDDVSRLVDGMMRRTMRERAIAVQTAVDELVNVIKNSTDEVFGLREESGPATGDAPSQGEIQRPWGGQGVLWDALTSGKREAPVLKVFERLALIP